MTQAAPVAHEPSAEARVAVLASAAVANLAVMLVVGSYVAPLALLVVALGHRSSWRNRTRAQSASSQLLMAGGMLLALAYLVLDLFTGELGGGLPQLTFALLLQAISSFALKTRRNLFSHLWLSLVVLYIGGLFAWTAVYIIPTLLWGAALLAFLVTARSRRQPAGPPRPRAWGRHAPWVSAWLAIAVAVFIAMPELPGSPLAVPLIVGVPLSGSAEALPPILPLVGAGSGSIADGNINLRARGSLGTEVVFHVRGGVSGYWRAYALETYSGESWTPNTETSATVAGDSQNLGANFGGEPDLATQTVTQTFFMNAPLGDDLLGAYPIANTYFPAQSLTVDDDGTVVASSELGNGISYAVQSAVRDTSPLVLESVPSLTPAEVNPADLELPNELPGSVAELAQQVVSDSPSDLRATEYGEVMALTDYLQQNYRYNLDAPAPPPGSDAVAEFLFDQRQGFCEQFASALAVMLRTQGIPARLAVGYVGGVRDPITGVYTVTAADAHAWVEVYFPTVGWVPFDATPGTTTAPTVGTTSPWLFNLQSLVTSGGVSGGARVMGALAAGLLVLSVLVWIIRRRRRVRRLPPTVRRYAAAQYWLRLAGYRPRAPAQTVAQHLALLEAADTAMADALRPLAQAVTRHLYADGGELASLTPLIRLSLRRRLL